MLARRSPVLPLAALRPALRPALAALFLLTCLGAALDHPVPAVGAGRPSPVPGEGAARFVPVLIYHHLAPPDGRPPNAMIVTPELFEAQVACLARLGYRTPDLNSFAAFVAGRTPLPARSVLFTFDDGYASFREYAWPVLKRYGLRAVIFPIGESIPGDEEAAGPDRPRPNFPHLGWEELRALAAEGVEIGSHSWAGHRQVDGRSALVRWGVERSRADLVRFREELVRRRVPLAPAFSYPYGDRDEHVERAVREAGYTLAFTTEEGVVRPGDDPHRLRRRFVSGLAPLADFPRLLVPPEAAGSAPFRC